MGFHRVRLVRETILELPGLKTQTNQPLVFSPDSPLNIISDEVFNDPIVQYYLAQNSIVEIGEDGAPVPPPAAPEIQSDAERGVGPTRDEKPAGANPEDGTRERPKTYPRPGTPMGGYSQAREDRPAGANPEDGTRHVNAGHVNPSTGQIQGDLPNRERDKDAPPVGQPKPGEEPTSAIDEAAPQFQASKAEGEFKQALDEHGHMRQPTGNATAPAAEELAGRRDGGTSTVEGAPTPENNLETSAELAHNEDTSKGSHGSTKKRR